MIVRNKTFFRGVFLWLFLGFSMAKADTSLQFPKACLPGKKIVVAAVGDLLFHYPLQFKAVQQGFDSLWQEALPYLKSAHITYGNLEGPIAAGIDAQGKPVDPNAWKVYLDAQFPHFNYHPSLAQDLKKSGFDILSTANNHTLDRGAIGVSKTIDILEKNHLLHTGTTINAASSPYSLSESSGIKIAWIACTEHTNGIKDKAQQVLHCYQKDQQTLILSTIQSLKNQVDAIIVVPHWGAEYQTTPQAMQTQFAQQVLNAGATAVIGSHPHVLQPVKKYTTPDGRDTLISYSLGNFVSYQGSPKNRASMILLVGFTKTAHETIINGVRFVPTYMENRSGWENLGLRIPTKSQFLKSYASFYSHIIPQDKALFSLPLETNPECHTHF